MGTRLRYRSALSPSGVAQPLNHAADDQGSQPDRRAPCFCALRITYAIRTPSPCIARPSSPSFAASTIRCGKGARQNRSRARPIWAITVRASTWLRMLGSPRWKRTVMCTGTRGERRSLRTWGGPECGDFFRPAPAVRLLASKAVEELVASGAVVLIIAEIVVLNIVVVRRGLAITTFPTLLHAGAPGANAVPVR